MVRYLPLALPKLLRRAGRFRRCLLFRHVDYGKEGKEGCRQLFRFLCRDVVVAVRCCCRFWIVWVGLYVAEYTNLFW